MRLPRGAPLNIALEFDVTRARAPVARLAMSESLAQLEWSPEPKQAHEPNARAIGVAAEFLSR